MPAWIFGQPTKCTFNSMARAAACGSRQKSRTPSYSKPRPARVWGISGPCACGMGGSCSVWKPANLMGPASFSFSSNFAPPVVGPGDGLWSLPTTPLITTRDSTNRGGKSTPTVLSWTSFPLTVPNSTRSNECGSSHAVAACIIATSKILRTLSALSKRNLQIGHVATMCYADYAQLLKTLCLAQPGLRLSVFVQWAWTYLTRQRGSRLIVNHHALAQTRRPAVESLGTGVSSGRT